MLTRKHFRDIAMVVKECRDFASDPENQAGLEGAVDIFDETLIPGLADCLARSNPRFNRDLFFTACGLLSEPIRVPL